MPDRVTNQFISRQTGSWFLLNAGVRDDDGRKLDHKTLDELRPRAVRRIPEEGAGAHPDEVAAALGLNRSTVYGWLARFREGGEAALRARPVPGRPQKLSGSQIARLDELIVGRDPRQLSFAFALWTREMVRQVIRREFGVALSVVSVGRLLRTMGLSLQHPLYRAYQQNPGRRCTRGSAGVSSFPGTIGWRSDSLHRQRGGVDVWGRPGGSTGISSVASSLIPPPPRPPFAVPVVWPFTATSAPIEWSSAARWSSSSFFAL